MPKKEYKYLETASVVIRVRPSFKKRINKQAQIRSMPVWMYLEEMERAVGRKQAEEHERFEER